MTSRTFRVSLESGGAMGAIPLPFDPRAVFGRVRVPVVVTVNGYRYRSTVSSIGGRCWIPLRKSHRDAAGLAGNENVEVTVEEDLAPRVVDVPDDLARALRKDPVTWTRWNALSYTRQREWVEAVEGARRDATRERRIADAVRSLADRD